MATSPTIAQLKKWLYNAARACVNKDYRSDPDAVRACRDKACSDLFGKAYDELDESQLSYAIGELNKRSKYNFATYKQKATLRFYALGCALVYAPFDGIKYVEPLTGEIFEGHECREAIQIMFEKYEREGKNPQLPHNVFTHLYNDWINPKAHYFLISGGFKTYVKNKHEFYYEQMQQDEADHLIKCFKQMHAAIRKWHHPNVDADYYNN